MSGSLTQLLEDMKKGRYVCPQPIYWNRLWEMLPNRHRKGAGWVPSAPLVLAAWWVTSDDEKLDRFTFHLKWAERGGVFPEIEAYARRLRPDQWHIRNN